MSVLTHLNNLNRHIRIYNETGDKKEFIEYLRVIANHINNVNYKIWGYKVVRDDKDVDDPITQIFDRFNNIESIRDKEILYDERFIKYFYEILWGLLKKIGMATQNLHVYVPNFMKNINRITINNYMIDDCRSTHQYNCGRAMIVVDKNNSRLLIFNTDDKGNMDINVQMDYVGASCNNLKQINIDDIVKYYGSKHKRILAEIRKLSQKYAISLYKIDRGIRIVATNGDNISFDLPLNYPNEPPSGTFNGLTISDVDILSDGSWVPSTLLISIVNKIKNKGLISVPTKKTLDKICF